MISKYYMLACLMLISTGASYSQGFMSPSGVMISHAHAKDGLMFTYAYMDMLMKDNWSGSEPVSEEQIWNQYLFAPQKMHMGMHMLMGMYGLSDRISVMMMTEYRSSSMTMTLPPGTVLEHHHGDSTMNVSIGTIHEHATYGFGDIKLWGIYKLLSHENTSLLLSLGLNVPTGKIDIEADEHALYEGEHHPYMMQLGTGTLDFMPGVTYVADQGQFSWSVQALSTIRPFYNKLGYHYGSDLTMNAWLSCLVTSFMSISARVEGYTGSAIAGYDPAIYAVTSPSADPQCYGGQRMSVYAGANFYIDGGTLRNTKIGIEFGAPVLQHVNGIQQVLANCLNASFTKAF